MNEARVIMTILGMAAVTCLTRFLGFWLVTRFQLSRRFETWLSYLPGTVLIAIVAPALSEGGLAEAVAAGATALIVLRSRNLLLAMLGGICVVWVIRQF